MLVRSTEPLDPVPPRLTDALEHWASAAPDRTFLARRLADGTWARLTYAEAHTKARAIASHLLARGLSAERPLAILSGNSIEHALITLGGFLAGTPVAPISPAYALMSTDHARLRGILERLTPGLVFVEDADPFARAIASAVPAGVEIATCTGATPDRPATRFASLLEPAGSLASVDAAQSGVGPATIAKILYTSGSTGLPKGVITTHGMLSANQAMLRHWLAWAREVPPVLVDWLPWNHTFGGSHNVGLVLVNGGTLYIDDGRPTPAGIAITARNLREVSPNIYFNVPKGYEELLAHLRRDAELRDSFFRNLKMLFCSGASLSPHIAAELDRLAIESTGARILMVTAFGSTESAPACTVPTAAIAAIGNIGTPLPGLTLKLVPAADKLEIRAAGPTITPGYWREPERTHDAFDEEGFYCFGDAVRFAIPGDPAGGLLFDGRVSEDFKLSTGTWVSAGAVRTRLIAGLGPLARDAVLAGHDRNALAALIFPDLDGCRALLPVSHRTATDERVLAHPDVCAAFHIRLTALAATSPGSSTRVVRILLLAEPAAIDANEITDKGSLNQRAVLTRRSALVAALYADPPGASVIVAAAG